MLILTTLFIAIFMLLLHWGWLRKYDYWKQKGFPYLPGSFPFGTIRELTLMTKYQGYTIQELYNKLSPNPFGGVYIWNSPKLLLRDPEIIRAVMTKDFQHFTDRGRITPTPDDLLSMNLFDVGGDLWKQIRVTLTPAFTSGRIKNKFPMLEACALQLYKRLKKLSDNGGIVNIKNITMHYTLDVIMSCAFGLEVNAAENILLQDINKPLFQPYVTLEMKIKTTLGILCPWLLKICGISEFPKHASKSFTQLMKHIVATREKHGVGRNDLLDLILQLKHKDSLEDGPKEEPENESNLIEEGDSGSSLKLTEELLAAQCSIFYVAGYETSSSLQTYALYELALHQDIQQRLQVELDGVIKQNGGRLTYQALQEMPYLDQVISEALRKYPTLPILNRECTKSFKIPDHSNNLTIDKGTKIIIPVYALHNDPKYFPEPEKFDPERFSPKNKSSVKAYTYIPFGEGQRHCIGMRFALVQTKMGLCTILRQYKVLKSEDTPEVLPLGCSWVVTAAKCNKINLLLKPRDIY